MQIAYVVIFESSLPGPCSDRALVLRSQGLKPETIVTDGLYQLLVPEVDVATAREQLNTYYQENINWRPRTQPVKFDAHSPWAGIIAYVLIMLGVAWAAGSNLDGFNWYSNGKVDASLVRDGQWWRTFTALTLHADLGHLAGNIGFGLLFGFFAGQYLGSGVAWLNIMLAGGFGNALNSYLQSSSHTSVGASTAVFGALGLVAAYSWKRKLYPQDRWAYRMGPVVGGIALLAFTGTGGERTDVGAHLTGFVSGFGLGILFALWPHAIPKRGLVQWIAGTIAISLMAISWCMALGGFQVFS